MGMLGPESPELRRCEMLVVISPAKRLDWDTRPDVAQTQPAFLEDAVKLATTARRLSKPKLQALMGISADLAKLNQERFAAFEAAPAVDLTRPAVLAFAGDTYQGLDAGSLGEDTLAYAQDHLCILSGLYGLLRPMDAIQPYRLEMGSKLRTRRGTSLYAWWKDRLALALNGRAEALGSDVLVNCASQEYFGAVDLSALKLSVVTPSFLEEGADGPRMVSFHAKRARGAMARFIVENRVRDEVDLAAFDLGGYRFDAARSEPGKPVFTRPDAREAAA